MKYQKLLPSLLAVAVLSASNVNAGWFDKADLESIGKGALGRVLQEKKIVPPFDIPGVPSGKSPNKSTGTTNGAMNKSNGTDYSSAPEPFQSLALNAPDGVVPVQVPLLDGALSLNAMGNIRGGGLAPGAVNDTARFFDLLALKLEPRLFDQNPYHFAQAHLLVPEKRNFLAIHDSVGDNANLQSSIYTGGHLARWKNAEFEPGAARQDFVTSGYKEKLISYAPSLPFRMIATYGLQLGEYSKGAFPIIFPEGKPKPATTGQAAYSVMENLMGGLQLSSTRMQDPDDPNRCEEKDWDCRRKLNASQAKYLLSFNKLGDPMPTKLPMNLDQARDLVTSMGWGEKTPRKVHLVMEITVDGVKTSPTNPNEKVLNTRVSRVELYGDQARTHSIHTFVGGDRQAAASRHQPASNNVWGESGFAENAAWNSTPSPNGGTAAPDNWCAGLKALIASAEEPDPFQSIKLSTSCEKPGVAGYENCIAKLDHLLPRLGAYSVADSKRCTLNRSLVNHPNDKDALLSKLSCSLTLTEDPQQSASAMKQLHSDIQACIGIKPKSDGSYTKYDWDNKSLRLPIAGKAEAQLILGVAYGKNVTSDGKYCDPSVGGRTKHRCREALRYL